ncbi:MAG: ATP-grasp domain-containing protein, partial [Planctomycetota bacterium]|nr:ATP-grasp domain-containing protein [Planctomycetota bacterium]
MKGKRIAVLFDNPEATSERGPTWEQCGDMEEAARAVRTALESLGAEAIPVVIRQNDYGFVDELREAKPDLIVNLSDSLFGESQYEPTLAGILETLGMPFTGTGLRGLSLALDKGVAKAILRSHGLATPEGGAVYPGEESIKTLPLPAMVKPSAEDGSIGIATDSVVRTKEALDERVRYIWESYRQPALVEKFVEGREINVALWGNGDSLSPLPPSEIDFSEFPEGLPRIVTLNAKWTEGSPEYEGTRPVCPAEVSPDLLEKINETASKAFRIFQLHDFGRVDFRVDHEGRPYVIDINPNPDISPDAGFS